MVSGGVADPLGTGGVERHDAARVGAASRLQSKAGEIICALHEAKQELAAELEANLKQLKGVLQETQHIAREMEAVLREAKAEPDPAQLAKGGPAEREGGNPGEWDPPYRKQEPAGGGDEAWEPPQAAVQVYEN